MSSKIIISRKSEWVNSRIPFKVFIDDLEAGVVNNGSAEEFLVAPGPHSVTLKFGIYSGETISLILLPNENKYLKAYSAWKFFKFFQILFGLVLLLSIVPFSKRLNHFDSSRYLHFLVSNNIILLEILLISPYLLQYLYHLTIGRKKYIILEKDNDNIFSS